MGYSCITHTYPPSKECCVRVEVENRSNSNNLLRNKQRRHNPATLWDMTVSITAKIHPSPSYLQHLHFRGDYFHARWDHRCINKKRKVLVKTESICNTSTNFTIVVSSPVHVGKITGDKKLARESQSGRAGHCNLWKRVLTGSKGGRLGLPQVIQRRPALGRCTWLLGDVGISIIKSLGPKIPHLMVKANCNLFFFFFS